MNTPEHGPNRPQDNPEQHAPGQEDIQQLLNMSIRVLKPDADSYIVTGYLTDRWFEMPKPPTDAHLSWHRIKFVKPLLEPGATNQPDFDINYLRIELSLEPNRTPNVTCSYIISLKRGPDHPQTYFDIRKVYRFETGIQDRQSFQERGFDNADMDALSMDRPLIKDAVSSLEAVDSKEVQDLLLMLRVNGLPEAE